MTNDTSIEQNTCTINFCIMRWHFAVFQALCSNINHFKLKAYRFKAICPLGYDSRRAWSIAVLREQAFSTLIIWRFEIKYEHSVTTKTKTIIARATSTKPSPLTINERNAFLQSSHRHISQTVLLLPALRHQWHRHFSRKSASVSTKWDKQQVTSPSA